MPTRRAVSFVLCLHDLISDKTCFTPPAYIESLVLLGEIFDGRKKNEENPPNILIQKWTNAN